MYIIGYFFYALVFLSYFMVGEIHDIVNQSYLLAKAITIAMGGLYIYPLIIFIYINIFSEKNFKKKQLVDSQTKIAASVSVSLGLIGTFQGLTAMVSSIAGSMGGEGDMTDKMNSMLSAISSALSAMSYAFLTSILGVAVSVLLLLSLNFWLFIFKDKAEENSKTKPRATIKLRYDDLILDDLVELKETLKEISGNIDRQTKLNGDLFSSSKKISFTLSEIFNALKCMSINIDTLSKSRSEEVIKVRDEFVKMKSKFQKIIEILAK